MSDPSGMTAPSEPVPNQVRILASGENLGALQSAHRPVQWFSRIQMRGCRLFVFERGLVLSKWNGRGLKQFPVGQMQVKNTNDRTFLLRGPDGAAGFWPRHWSDGEALAKTLSRWAFSHPWR